MTIHIKCDLLWCLIVGVEWTQCANGAWLDDITNVSIFFFSIKQCEGCADNYSSIGTGCAKKWHVIRNC